MKGIDIYEGDNISDWNAIKNTDDVSVVIQKATQGISHVDSLLNYRYPRIRAAGLKIGFYHFANGGDPIAEAKHFLSAISGLTSDTILWLDIEAEEKWSKSHAISFANTFIKYVQEQGYGIGIYTGASFYNDYLAGNIPDVPLWLASYGRQPSLYPNRASWQYSESGRLSGAVGNVDLDYFIDDILNENGGIKKVKNIVCVNNSVDERAAGYLADFLQCPIINNALVKFDYTTVENVYCVGGGEFTSYAKKIITGADRYLTCRAVLNFIANGGK